MTGYNVCQVAMGRNRHLSLVKSPNNLHPKRRKRLLHYLLDKGIEQNAGSDSIVVGGTSVGIAGIESIDQIPITFEDMKAYDLDFLKPIDATQEQVDAWKDQRRRDNAAERQRRHRAQHRERWLKEQAQRLDAEAKHKASLATEATDKWVKLTPRAKEALRIIVDDGIDDAPDIAKVAAKRDAFNHRSKPGYATVAEPDREVRRALRILEKAGFVTLGDSHYWRQRTIRAVPTALAMTVPWRVKEPCHTMHQCPLSTENIAEIALAPVTLSKRVTNDKTGKMDTPETVLNDPMTSPSNVVIPFKRREVA